jgi:hypothetical protein
MSSTMRNVGQAIVAAADPEFDPLAVPQGFEPIGCSRGSFETLAYR